MARCHIKSAWPEFGPAPTLCGVMAPYVHGGMATADCRQCLTTALQSGHLNGLIPFTKAEVLRRLRFFGVVQSREMPATDPDDYKISPYGIFTEGMERSSLTRPSWSCKQWGKRGHDWIKCSDCAAKYDKEESRIMTADNRAMADYKITEAVRVIEPMTGSAAAALEYIQSEIDRRIQEEIRN